MADVADNPSSPASPRPDDIAQQQASRSDSPDRDKLRVFISYSRDDLEFADQADAALNACGFECVIDRHGISGGEDWKKRLGNLISEADTVVFVLTATSACSEICSWEAQEAERLGKRILPVIPRPLEDASPPPQLRERNYIFFYADPKAAPGAGFGTGLAKLIGALNTDFDWLREHTRYLQRAIEWDRGGRPANRLLSGDDIAEARAWAVRRPKSASEPTALHLDFIRASEDEAEARSSALRKQLDEMAAAQAERATALNKAEEAQRKRATMAKIRNIALVVATILALLAMCATVVGWRLKWDADNSRHVAEEQRAVAEEQREQADHILGAATEIIFKFEDQMDDDTEKEAFAVFQMGADHGNASSMVNLGNLYAHGKGVAQDYTKAREWYQKAADKGSWAGMASLAWLYREGFGVAQDYTKARELYEKAADEDESGETMVILGVFYDNGSGVPQNHAKAREWYERAADKNNAHAMFYLGLHYEDGRGVPQDYAKAREWFEKAADKNNADAMFHLGLLYSIGQGAPQDHTKAREWFEKAADKGNADAMTNLGLLYEHGLGVPQDYTKAREWFEKAADKGDASAMDNLGLVYENGHGVAQDYVKAREWYEKAAAAGDANATDRLNELPSRMQERSSGQKRGP
jgi:TPR repeat protein